MPNQDPFDDIVKGYDTQFSQPKVKPAKQAKAPSFDDLVKEYDGQSATPAPSRTRPKTAQTRQYSVNYDDGMTDATKEQWGNKPLPTYDDWRKSNSKVVPPGFSTGANNGEFKSPILMDFRAPTEAQKMANRATAPVAQPAPMARPKNAFQTPQVRKTQLERIQDRQAIESQQPQTVETDPAKLDLMRRETEQRSTQRRQLARQGFEQLNPMQRLATRAMAGIGGATAADMQDVMGPVGGFEKSANELTSSAIRGAAGIPEGLARVADRNLNRGDLAIASNLQKMLAAHPEWSPEEQAQAKARINEIYANQSAMGDSFQGITQAGRRVAETLTPTDPNAEASINPLNPSFYKTTLPRAAGSMLPFMAGGAAGAAAKVPTALTSAVLGVGMSVPEQYQKARSLGATPEQLARAVDTGTLAGLIEALGAKSLMGEVGGAGQRLLPRVATESAKEFGQETAQSAISDLGAKYNERTQPNLTAKQMAMNALEQGVPAAFLGAGGGIGSRVAEGSRQAPIPEQLANRTLTNQNAAIRAEQPAPMNLRPAMSGPTQITPLTQTARVAPSATPTSAIEPTVTAKSTLDTTEPLTEPLEAAESQPSALPRLPARELTEQDRFAQVYGAKPPAENRINKMIESGEALLNSPRENDRKQAENILKRSLAQIQKSEAYQAELGLPEGTPKPYTAVVDAIESKLAERSPVKSANLREIKPQELISREPSALDTTPTATGALRAEADAAKIRAAEFEQAGDFTQAAQTYETTHRNLKLLRRKLGMPKTPEDVSRINQIDREVSIAATNMQKAKMQARQMAKQANAPTAGLPEAKKLRGGEKPQAQVPLSQPVESAPLLRPEAVQNPESISQNFNQIIEDVDRELPKVDAEAAPATGDNRTLISAFEKLGTDDPAVISQMVRDSDKRFKKSATTGEIDASRAAWAKISQLTQPEQDALAAVLPERVFAPVREEYRGEGTYSRAVSDFGQDETLGAQGEANFDEVMNFFDSLTESDKAITDADIQAVRDAVAQSKWAADVAKQYSKDIPVLAAIAAKRDGESVRWMQLYDKLQTGAKLNATETATFNTISRKLGLSAKFIRGTVASSGRTSASNKKQGKPVERIAQAPRSEQVSQPERTEPTPIKPGDSVTWQRGDVTESGKVTKVNGQYVTAATADGQTITRDASKFTKAEARPKMREQKAPGFFSQLQRVIDAKMPAKASAAQVRAIIENPQSGVKPDEVKWTGLDDYLRGKGTVTKAEVTEFLKANQVEVMEVTKGGEQTDLAPEDIKRLDELSNLKFEKGLTASEQKEYQDLLDRQDATAPLPPKYGTYTLPGAKEGSYRELLLTLPKRQTSVPEFRNEDGVWIAEQNGQELGRDTNLRGLRQSLDLLPGAATQQTENYKSSHFDEPNILAHIRFNERQDAQGRRVLHIEEVQSDWHQEGRKKGYATSYAVRSVAGEQGDTVYEIYDVADGQQVGSRMTYEDQAQKQARKFTEESRRDDIPDAPFKKNWHELAFKRALRYAAENGYDAMTWTTGAQQADRFDLSKQVDRIEWNPVTEKLTAQKDGKEIINERVSADRLESYVGKDVAANLLKIPLPDKAKGPFERAKFSVTRAAEGDDLRVGGEGMKGFYDSILPAFANKYGRKWGVKVGEAKIETARKPPADTWRGDQSDRVSLEAVHSLPITDAMRESVMRGQALFRHEATPSVADVLSDTKIQFKSGKRGQAGTLYANEQALDVLRAAHEEVFGERVEFNNVNLNTPAARQMATMLMREADDPSYDAATARKLREVSREFNLAWRAGKTVSVVKTGSGRKFGDIKVSRRHELFHDAQEGLQNSRGFMAKHKHGQKLIEGLANYSFEDRTVEAAAFIAGGQAKDFGLTNEQGNEFLEDYFSDIVENNGVAALKRFFSVAPHAVETLKKAREKYGIQGKTGTNRSGTDGAGQDGRLGANDRAAREGEGLLRAPQSGRVREQGKARASFGSLANEPRGQVLASGLNIQSLFKNKPKTPAAPAKPAPVPADWNQKKWVKKAMDKLVTRDMSKEDREKFYDFSTKKPERLALLQKYMPSQQDISALMAVIARADNAVKNNDGDDLHEAVWAAQAITERPATNSEKASSLMRAAMFSRPTGRMRDVISNAAMQKLESVVRTPGAMADATFTAVRRLLTGEGERTFLGPRPGQFLKNRSADRAKQWKQAKDVLKGKHVEALEDILQHREVNFDNKFLDKTTKAVFRVMGAADQFFFVKEYERAIREQAELTARADVRSGLVSKTDLQKQTEYYSAAPTTEMKVLAELAAKQIVFRNPNLISDKIIKPIRENLPPGGNFALDIVMPVDRTPTNVILAALEYSPLGAVKLAGQMAYGTAKTATGTLRNRKTMPTREAVKKSLDEAFPPAKQRAMSRLFGRTVTGTSAPVLLGYALAAAGMATGFYDEDDPGDEATRREEGKMPNSVKIAGRWWELSGIAPLGSLIGLGATLHREIHAETLDPEKRYARLLKGFGNMAMDLPALESLKQTVKIGKAATGRPADLGRITGNIGSRFVPGIVGDVGQSIPGVRDPYEREIKAPKSGEKDSSSMLKKAGREFAGEFAAKIPGARRLLPQKMNSLTGKPIETEWHDVIDPFRSRKAVESSQLSDVKQAQVKFDISTEIKPKLGEPDAVFKQRKERVEGWMEDYGQKLLNDPRYQALSPAMQEKAAENLRIRIGRQQNVKQPKLDPKTGEIASFNAGKIVESVQKSATGKPARDAKKLWAASPR